MQLGTHFVGLFVTMQYQIVKHLCRFRIFVISSFMAMFVYVLLYHYVLHTTGYETYFTANDRLQKSIKNYTINAEWHINAVPMFSDVMARKLEQNMHSQFSTGYKLRLGSRKSINCDQTTFTVLGEKAIHFGEFFSIVIKARDKNGQTLERGGDFWFATISNSKLATRSAGKVIDYKNGTYEVIFLASFTGNVTVDIVLVAQTEAIAWLRQVFWPAEQKLKWVGYFSGQTNYNSKKKTKKKSKVETSFCYLQGGLQWNDKCEFRHATALGSVVFACGRPATFECDSLIAIKIEPHHASQMTKRMIAGKEYMFNSSYRSLSNGPTTVRIIDRELPISTVDKVLSPDFFQLSVCLPDQLEPLTEGYWVGNKWINLRCKTKEWRIEEIKHCIRKKKFYLMGDSTTRQWLEVLTKYLGYKADKNYKYTKIVANHNNTLNALFQFYPFIVTNRKISIDDVKFESDLLQSLPENGCDYIIVISPWAHYTQWKQSDYRRRLEQLRNAILRFRGKCPNTPIIIKGSHARHYRSSLRSIYSSDYTLFMIGKTMENVFKGIGVYFMDVWDMNLAYSFFRKIHMPTEAVMLLHWRDRPTFFDTPARAPKMVDEKSHLKSSRHCKQLANEDCFTILDSASTTQLLKIKFPYTNDCLCAILC
ncbi:NXPE family member 3-like [Anneissia japonica]|uniref:NXPE family member 3-like n=1 Tax=Anneissia japonica TaxID=1529436 RepID=UPI0014256FA9|nr:NXPE family member 3-like [Anneissia japonica]